ncbi:MAG: hypothetical protein K5663_08435 [Clostridiales bacterium]|nr:hypothetical protein [Clostridiales bacterium]
MAGLKLADYEVQDLNVRIRARCRDLAVKYNLPLRDQRINRLLRDAYKARFGGLVKETLREDYYTAREFIESWEDTDRIRLIHKV